MYNMDDNQDYWPLLNDVWNEYKWLQTTLQILDK